MTGSERETEVQSMFSSIADRYDLNNTILSFGLHRYWKWVACRIAAGENPKYALDIGAGTCDLSIMLASKCPDIEHIVAVDLNAAMLEVGEKKIHATVYADKIECCRGNVESLNFRNNIFDIVMAGFCIRNVGHLDQALQEIYRVLKPGGSFVCLEFSHPTSRWLRLLYHWYSMYVLPWIPTWISGDQTKVYRYLPASIREFPDQNALVLRMQDVGFSEVNYQDLNGGIVAIHRAVK